MMPARRGLALHLPVAAGAAALLLVWAAVSFVAGSYLVPAPWTSAVDTAILLSQGFPWSQIAITLGRVASGFCAGFAAGLAVGIAAGSRPGFGAFFRPIVQFFQGMPPLLWAIPLVALMGIGHLPAVTVIALITFPLVAVTISEGMTTLPRVYAEMLAVFAPGFRARLGELILPHLRPFVGASLKAGLVLAVKASVTAEYFGAADGIGFQIQSAYMSMRIRSLFAWAIVLILTILAFTFLVPRAALLLNPARRLLDRERALPPHAAPPKPAVRTVSSGPPLRIILRGVGFSWQGTEALIEEVNLSVPAGRIAVITGDSGVGKTTLLRIAAGLLHPSAGSASAPSRLGLVFQDDRLLPWRSVLENTALPLLYSGQPRREALAIAESFLAEAGLKGADMRRPEDLSGGMRKRVALARCFARSPDAVFMDEPFTGLHAEARKNLWEVVLRFLSRYPAPAIVVTHYPDELSRGPACRFYTLAGRPARLKGA